VQEAYETELVTASGTPLRASGRVTSSQSEGVELQSPALAPDAAFAVRVRWWAAGAAPGAPSGWSSWLNFTTGLSTKADWSGAVWLAGDDSVSAPGNFTSNQEMNLRSHFLS
jgi:hypothetical protein